MLREWQGPDSACAFRRRESATRYARDVLKFAVCLTRSLVLRWPSRTLLLRKVYRFRRSGTGMFWGLSYVASTEHPQCSPSMGRGCSSSRVALPRWINPMLSSLLRTESEQVTPLRSAYRTAVPHTKRSGPAVRYSSYHHMTGARRFGVLPRPRRASMGNQRDRRVTPTVKRRHVQC